MNHPALEIDYDPSDELKLRYEILCQQQPNIRARDAANLLNVSEAELAAAGAGDTSFHLTNHPEAILTALESIGEVLSITHNETAITEKKGAYNDLSFSDENGLKTAQSSTAALGLRLLLNNWHYSFLVFDYKQIGHSKSLQFFDATGQAVHKIYLTQNSDEAAFEKIISRFISSYQPTYLDIIRHNTCSQIQPEQDVQWHQARQNWAEMQSSYDFFQLLIGNNVTRQQAYDNVDPELAYEIIPSELTSLFNLAKTETCSLCFAVGNQGCMQLHSGPVQKTNEFGNWFNILDTHFNLHINTHRLTQAWVVRKPLNGSHVTSVEFFDDQDQLALQITAERKAGMQEPSHWRELVAQLEPRFLEVSALSIYDAVAG